MSSHTRFIFFWYGATFFAACGLIVSAAFEANLNFAILTQTQRCAGASAWYIACLWAPYFVWFKLCTLCAGAGAFLLVSIKTFIVVHGFGALSTFVSAAIIFNPFLYISSLWASWVVKSLWWGALGSYLASWFWLIFKIVFVFLTLILIRITVPRFKLETLSRLSWYGLFAFGACLLLCYLLGGFWC